MGKEYAIVDLLRFLRKKSWFFLAVSLLIGCVVYFVVDRWNDTHEQYVATTYFAVAHTDRDEEEKSKYQTQVYAQQYNVSLLKTITKLVQTPKVVGEAIKNVEKGSRYEADQLYGSVVGEHSKKIGVGNDKDTMIVTITYRADTAKYAAKMSNELFNQTRVQSKKIWGTDNLKLIQKATVPTHRSEVSALKISLLVAFGFLVGLSIIYVLVQVTKDND